MKTVIVALNSKFIHMSLAPWYLKAAVGDGCGEIKIIETTINRNTYDIMRAIYDEKPDLLGFSCYIFNIIQIEQIVNDIKKLVPKLKIVLGGPEVSYDAQGMLRRCAGVDYIVRGEGERVFSRLVTELYKGNSVCDIQGLVYRRENGEIAVNPLEEEGAVNLESPYTDEMLSEAKGKIIYFEGSRGCPFSCSYCLSPAGGGVRFFRLERVMSELKKVMMSQARQVKFVDRTFNCNLSRAKEIIRFIILSAENDKTGTIKAKNFHFETAADLFDDELIELLGTAPHGLIQLEIGIQSLNGAVLEATDRKTDIEKCTHNIKRLLVNGNIHIHLDIIAGLPLEDYASLARSFDGVFEMGPHTIQLGFLKLLKGSRLREQARGMGIVYESLPPYEVLSTPWMSFDELSRLKFIAQCCERLYNSGRFSASLRFIVGRFPAAFAFFEAFSAFLSLQGCFDRALSLRELYDIFAAYAQEKLNARDARIFSELLKFDYFSTDNACNPPAGLMRIYNSEVKELYIALKNNRQHSNISSGRIHFESFAFDPLLFIEKGGDSGGSVVLCFDYGVKDMVSGLYNFNIVH